MARDSRNTYTFYVLLNPALRNLFIFRLALSKLLSYLNPQQPDESAPDESKRLTAREDSAMTDYSSIPDNHLSRLAREEQNERDVEIVTRWLGRAVYALAIGGAAVCAYGFWLRGWV